MDRLPDPVGLGHGHAGCSLSSPSPRRSWHAVDAGRLHSPREQRTERKGQVATVPGGGRTAEQLREDTRTHARTHAHAVTHAHGHRGFLPGARDTPLSLGCWKRQTSMAGTATCMLSRGQPPSGPPGSRSRQPPVLGPSEKKSSKLPINQTCGL